MLLSYKHFLWKLHVVTSTLSNGCRAPYVSFHLILQNFSCYMLLELHSSV